MRRGLRALHLVDFRRFTSPKHALTHFVRLNASLGLTVSKAALTERFSRALARGVFLFFVFIPSSLRPRDGAPVSHSSAICRRQMRFGVSPIRGEPALNSSDTLSTPFFYI